MLMLRRALALLLAVQVALIGGPAPRDLLGASAVQAAGLSVPGVPRINARGAGLLAPVAPAANLAPLALSATAGTVGVPFSATITGRTSGSTLALGGPGAAGQVGS